jgi:hypothetical protein
MHTAGIVHLARPLALGDHLTQIRQPHVGTVPLDQCLLVILPRPAAFLAPSDRTDARWLLPNILAFLGRSKTAFILEVDARTNMMPSRRTRPEQVRRYAYLCVGVAARNRQNQPRPSSLLRPVATGRVPITTPDIRSGSAFGTSWANRT